MAEDEVLHMLTYADADHRVVSQIKEARSGAFRNDAGRYTPANQ